MNNEKLKLIKNEDFDKFFNLLHESFPNEERRSYKGQAKILYENSYKILGNKDNKGNLNAFIAAWEFEEFNFIEHFAVNSKIRGNGIGTAMLNSYLNNCKKPIFLEVEYPENDIAIRRIEFYKRLGFFMNNYDYIQPPLQKGNKNLPLKVMSYPNKVDEKEFNLYKKKVYTKVYKVKV